MALPENVTTRTVDGAFVRTDGTVAAGTVTFTPAVARLLDATEDVILFAKATTVTLDENGEFTVDLVVTDDTDLNPVDWTYTVDVKVGGSRWSFSMDVPAGVGPIHLADVAPVASSTGDAVVVGPAGPAGGVTSVNGGTGVVELVAGDIPATPSVGLSADTIQGQLDQTNGLLDDNATAIETLQDGVETALLGKVDGLNGATGLWIGTEAAYALLTPDPNVVYVTTP